LRCRQQVRSGTKIRERERKRLMRVYILHFFNCLHLPASLPPAENRILRKSSWPCWNVCFPLLTGTTRQERRVGRCREGWRLGDHCVRYSVLDVSLVAGVAGLVVEGTAIHLVQVDDGGDGVLQPYVVHHSKPERSPNPQTHRRT